MEDSVTIVEAPLGSEFYRQCLALREAVLRRPLGLRLSEQELADDALRQHFCAVAGAEVVGCVSLRPLEAGAVQLKQMAVAPEWRMRRIGERLVAEAETWARQQGFTSMLLHARIGAEEFYAKAGYAPEGEIFEENTIPHILMTKPLV